MGHPQSLDKVLTLPGMSSVEENRTFLACEVMEMVRRDLEGMADDAM